MKTVEFGGGLGDIFIDIYKCDIYTRLESLEPGERAQVVLLSANPGVHDLFRWHPKAQQFDIFDIRSANPWGPEQRQRFGILEPTPRGQRNGSPVIFYPCQEDLNVLATIPRPYVVFGVSAGAPEVNIQLSMAEEAADVAIKKGITVVTVGRNFSSILKDLNQNIEVALPRTETRLTARNGLIDTIDRLSVPGLAFLVRDAAAVFSCHSCLLSISWQFRTPLFVLWHPMKRREWEEPCGTTWGRHLHGTRNMCFSDWNPSAWASFLDEFGKR